MLADYSAAVTPPGPYLPLPRRVGPARLARLRHRRLLAMDDDGALGLEVVVLSRDEENRRVSRFQRKVGGEIERRRPRAVVAGLARGLEEDLAIVVVALDEDLQIPHAVRIGGLAVEGEPVGIHLDPAVAGIEIRHGDAARLLRLNRRTLRERSARAGRLLHECRGDESRPRSAPFEAVDGSALALAGGPRSLLRRRNPVRL